MMIRSARVASTLSLTTSCISLSIAYTLHFFGTALVPFPLLAFLATIIFLQSSKPWMELSIPIIITMTSMGLIIGCTMTTAYLQKEPDLWSMGWPIAVSIVCLLLVGSDRVSLDPIESSDLILVSRVAAITAVVNGMGWIVAGYSPSIFSILFGILLVVISIHLVPEESYDILLCPDSVLAGGLGFLLFRQINGNFGFIGADLITISMVTAMFAAVLWPSVIGESTIPGDPDSAE